MSRSKPHAASAQSAAAAGEALYRRQDPHTALYMILAGQVRIIDDFGGPHERGIVEYGPGAFVGEYNLLTGQAAYASAVVVAPARLIEIRPGRLRELMAQEETLSELILRALLRRRVFMIGLRAGVSIIGSSYSADARRLLEFTARNQILRSWVDIEHDAAAEAMLGDFGVAPAERHALAQSQPVKLFAAMQNSLPSGSCTTVQRCPGI